jgi:hypothetical protein
MFCNLQPGDLDLLKEDNTTPLHWPTGVIKETHPGKDGVIRVVTLRTPKGTFKCPLQKSAPSRMLIVNYNSIIPGGGRMFMLGTGFLC